MGSTPTEVTKKKTRMDKPIEPVYSNRTSIVFFNIHDNVKTLGESVLSVDVDYAISAIYFKFNINHGDDDMAEPLAVISELIDSGEKISTRFQLQNKVGNPAGNIFVTLKFVKITNLHELVCLNYEKSEALPPLRVTAEYCDDFKYINKV